MTIRVGKPDVAPDASAHVKGVDQGNAGPCRSSAATTPTTPSTRGAPRASTPAARPDLPGHAQPAAGLTGGQTRDRRGRAAGGEHRVHPWNRPPSRPASRPASRATWRTTTAPPEPATTAGGTGSLVKVALAAAGAVGLVYLTRKELPALKREYRLMRM